MMFWTNRGVARSIICQLWHTLAHPLNDTANPPALLCKAPEALMTSLDRNRYQIQWSLQIKTCQISVRLAQQFQDGFKQTLTQKWTPRLSAPWPHLPGYHLSLFNFVTGKSTTEKQPIPVSSRKGFVNPAAGAGQARVISTRYCWLSCQCSQSCLFWSKHQSQVKGFWVKHSVPNSGGFKSQDYIN